MLSYQVWFKNRRAKWRRQKRSSSEESENTQKWNTTKKTSAGKTEERKSEVDSDWIQNDRTMRTFAWTGDGGGWFVLHRCTVPTCVMMRYLFISNLSLNVKRIERRNAQCFAWLLSLCHRATCGNFTFHVVNLDVSCKGSDFAQHADNWVCLSNLCRKRCERLSTTQNWNRRVFP